MPRYRPIMRRMQELWKVSSWAAWEPVRAHDSAAPIIYHLLADYYSLLLFLISVIVSQCVCGSAFFGSF